MDNIKSSKLFESFTYDSFKITLQVGEVLLK